MDSHLAQGESIGLDLRRPDGIVLRLAAESKTGVGKTPYLGFKTRTYQPGKKHFVSKRE